MTAAKALAKQFETASVKFTNELNGGGVSQSALVPLTQQYASALTAFASGLSKLTPPANLANDQATVINGVKGLIPIILKLGRDGAAGNKAATQADAQAIQSALLKLKGPGKKLGLK